MPVGGNDIVDGGDDPDFVSGGNGRDIVIGGRSRDTISGGDGEDILINGYTSFRLTSEALTSVHAEWSSGHSLAHRRRNVLGNNHPAFHLRFNGDYFLREGVTVHDDGALDEILTDAADGDADLLFVDSHDDYLLGAGDLAI